MPRSKVTKEVYNKQRRDYYAAHKDQINKRRRELYAEKKNLRKEVSMEIHENGPNEDGFRGEEVCIDASPDPGTTSRMSESLLQNESLAYLTGEATNSSVNEDMMNHSTPSGDIGDQLVIQTTTEMGVNQRLIQLILRSLGKKSYKGDLGGQFMGKHVWIPRIPLEPNPADNKYSIPFVRRQVPLRLCFAMTINKSQGQTLDYVGIYLRQPVFTHGQLYVALSRAKTGKNVKVLLIPPTWNDPATKYTSNIVFSEILEKARPA